MPKPARRPVVLALAVATVAALPAQDSADPGGLLARAIDDLGEPARAQAAAATLLGLDAAVAVPSLAALVVVPQRYVEPRPRVLGALFVLGQFGRRALPALPALANASIDRDWGVADQALWALGAVGCHADAAQRLRLCDALPGSHFTVRVARQRLLLGDAPELAQQRGCLCADDAAVVTAACLLLRPPLPPTLASAAGREALQRDVHAQLERALRPVSLPWEPGPLRAAASALAAAWCACSDDPGDLAVGRGLLQHFDAAMRRRGLGLVQALCAGTLTERSELLPLLFDRDAEIRQVAAWNLGSCGARGLLALPALRRLQRIDGDVGVRMACGAVADDLLAAVADDGRGPLLAAIDARLRGEATVPLALPGDGAGIATLVEILCGAEWCEPATVRRLLPELPADGCMPRPLFFAVLRYCVNVDPELRALAAGYAARYGHGVATAELESRLDQIADFTGGGDPALVEMLAWIRAGRNATSGELQAALLHSSPRVVVRAMVEWLRRAALRGSAGAGSATDGAEIDVDVLHRLLQREDPSDRLRSWILGVDLGPELRAAATLVLTALGVDGVDPAPLGVLAPADAERGAWLQQERTRSELARLGADLEAQVQQLLDVPDGVAPR